MLKKVNRDELRLLSIDVFIIFFLLIFLFFRLIKNNKNEIKPMRRIKNRKMMNERKKLNNVLKNRSDDDEKIQNVFFFTFFFSFFFQMIFSFFRRTFATERTRRALRSTFDQIQRPKKTNRTDFFNGKNVIRAIICANGFVFVLWKFSYANLRTNFDDRFLWFMTKNFSKIRREKFVFDLFSSFQWSRGPVSLIKNVFGHF